MEAGAKPGREPTVEGGRRGAGAKAAEPLSRCPPPDADPAGGRDWNAAGLSTAAAPAGQGRAGCRALAFTGVRSAFRVTW